jgi:hypothetical protein
MEPGRDMDDWLEAEREFDTDGADSGPGIETVTQQSDGASTTADKAVRMDGTEEAPDGTTAEARDGQSQIPRRGRDNSRESGRAARTTL